VIANGTIDQPKEGASGDNSSSSINATQPVLSSELTDPSGHSMVLVPAGSFEMGGNDDIALAECLKLLKPELCDRDRHVRAAASIRAAPG